MHYPYVIVISAATGILGNKATCLRESFLLSSGCEKNITLLLMFKAIALVWSCLLQWVLLTTEGQRGTNRYVFYAVEMDGGVPAARALAQSYGLEFISQIGSLQGLFTLRDSRGRPNRAALEKRLAATAEVRWAQRQHGHYRDKRASLSSRHHHNNTTESSPQRTQDVSDRRAAEEQMTDHALTFNDPLWPMQWELFAQGEYSSSGFDLNVMPVWIRNITGSGVVVSIIDDGVDHTNKDLTRNFEACASLDLRGSHGLSHDPMPLRDEENGHGTRCAGEVAMEANNSYCGVGVAFNAKIGGIRLLDGLVTDAMEATALTFNNHLIHIYVCCWGPRDDGAEMGGPGRLAQRAFRKGTQKGRAGKGSVFVWAAGNGGMNGDHCGADGYVNSIYSVAVGAVTHTGRPAFFGEPCPGVMAVTLTGASVGGSHTPLVTVTNLGDGCITHFAGTSSAAPIAAGILALVLEANPELTWREVQHLIAKTAKIPDPHEPGWSINGAGYHVHHRYGFGVLDAGLMVQQAVHLHTVPPQRNCTKAVTLDHIRVLAPGGMVTVDIQSDGCDGTDTEVNTLEHVQLKVNMSSVCRGDLSVELRSPSGTVSTLLGRRPNDASARGLRGWTMMTVHCWGERPHGVWTLQVTDHRGTVRRCGRQQTEESAGALHSVTLILYGTYDPRTTTTHDGPLKTIVSMGSYHPVPQTGVYAGDRHPPVDLILWTYQMERDQKVRAADIPVLDNTSKNSRQPLRPLLPLSYQEDRREGNRSLQLQERWKSLGDGKGGQQRPL